MTTSTTAHEIQSELSRLGVASLNGVEGLDVLEDEDEDEDVPAGHVRLGDTESIALPAHALLAALRALPDDAGVTTAEIEHEGSGDRARYVAVWRVLSALDEDAPPTIEEILQGAR